MNKQARALAQSTLGRLGYRLARVRADGEQCKPPLGLDFLFPLLKQLGFAPKHVVDVGANHGNWTRTALKYFPEAQYTLIEPQRELKSCIRDLVERGCKIRWVAAGASDQTGVAPFTICGRDDSSNFRLSEDQARAAGLQCIEVPVRTLDEIIATENLPIPEMVKIDAEGFDLKVLAGASSLVGKTEIFLIEADLRGERPNSVLEVMGRMSECGYELLDITELNRSPKYGVLWLMEMAFIRKGSRLLQAAPTYE